MTPERRAEIDKEVNERYKNLFPNATINEVVADFSELSQEETSKLISCLDRMNQILDQVPKDV